MDPSDSRDRRTAAPDPGCCRRAPGTGRAGRRRRAADRCRSRRRFGSRRPRRGADCRGGRRRCRRREGLRAPPKLCTPGERRRCSTRSGCPRRAGRRAGRGRSQRVAFSPAFHALISRSESLVEVRLKPPDRCVVKIGSPSSSARRARRWPKFVEPSTRAGARRNSRVTSRFGVLEPAAAARSAGGADRRSGTRTPRRSGRTSRSRCTSLLRSDEAVDRRVERSPTGSPPAAAIAALQRLDASPGTGSGPRSRARARWSARRRCARRARSRSAWSSRGSAAQLRWRPSSQSKR